MCRLLIDQAMRLILLCYLQVCSPLQPLGRKQPRRPQQQRDGAVHAPAPNSRPHRRKQIILLVEDEDDIINQPEQNIQLAEFIHVRLIHAGGYSCHHRRREEQQTFVAVLVRGVGAFDPAEGGGVDFPVDFGDVAASCANGCEHMFVT